MRIKTTLTLSLFLLTSIALSPSMHVAEERRTFDREYQGLSLEVYAPYQAYPGETIRVRVRVEALEDIKNTSVTVFIWGSKSEGYSPWGTSFTVLDVADLPGGTVQDREYNVTIPSDISPGLTYGIMFLQWSIFRQSWEGQWDKASFRLTYIRNKDYEDLQIALQNTKTLMYAFLSTTIILVVLVVYFTKRSINEGKDERIDTKLLIFIS